jgi:hypothetical protein
MKKLFAVATAALFLSSAALAGEWEIPSNIPAAAITMPDDWETQETSTGLEGTSPDNAVYFSVDIAAAKKMDQVIDDAAKFLDEQGVKIDASTQHYAEDKLNGRDIVYIDWSGEDKDGPASVGLAVLILNEKTVLVLTYWGTKGEEEKHQNALGQILASIRPAE